MTLPGLAPAPTTIVFGTDGWRARIADEFTYDNVRRCADGVAAYVVERGETAKGVVVAYDRRFSSEYFAMAAAEILLAHDIPVAFAVHAVPTQMSSYEVVERGSAAGIVITASHNPWVDNGFKVKAPTGAAAGADILGVIERRLAANGGIGLDRRPFADAEAAGLVERFDPYDGYERFVRRTVDLDALRDADMSVLVDPMWGAGSGWLSRLLAGGRIRVDEIHQERNPVLRRRQPGADPPEHRRGARPSGGGRLRPRAAARRRRGSGRCRRRARHVPPPARGDRTADVLPRRASRLARPGRRQRQQHLDGGAARRALRDHDLRDAGRLQVHRPEDDRDGRDDGRGGIGRLRVRDAPARARWRLRRPAAARPVHARARGRALAGVARGRAFPRARRAVVLPAHRRPRRAGGVRRDEAATAGRPRGRAADRARGRADRPDRAARHRRRLQVLPRPTGRGCSSGRPAPSRWSASTPRRPRPSCAMRCWSPASGWCADHEQRRNDAAGRQAVGPRAHLGPHGPRMSARSWSSRPASGCRSSATRSRTNRSS